MNTSLRHHSCQRRAGAGMTLVELMVTLSLMATLLLIAIPGFRSQVASTRLTTATNELNATLTRARAESMRLGARVTVCKGDAGASTCSSSTTTGWEQGWMVFQDPTRSGSIAAIDSGETTTFKVQPLSSDLKIQGNAPLMRYVSFAADGKAKTLSGGDLFGTIRVCNTSSSLADNNRARDLILVATGRVVINTPASVDSTCPAPT
jgi:type IV fimbrial biogenesis protein FimT